MTMTSDQQQTATQTATGHPVSDRPPVLERLSWADARWHRVGALVLRYWYLMRGSLPRLIEIIYWPLIQLLIWGFVSVFLVNNTNGLIQVAGVIIGAVLLWEVVLRAQIGISLAFLEEMWSRNLGHLFVSPLHPLEWIGGLIIVSVMRSAIGLIPAMIAAYFLFAFSIFELGLPLVFFFANLMAMGWWIGVMILCLILRYGMGAESFAWMALFVLAPFSCVYYPIETLPGWLQLFALTIPATHVFEGMRGVLIDGVTDWGQLAVAAGLNLLYIALSIWLYLAAFRHARTKGTLLAMGE